MFENDLMVDVLMVIISVGFFCALGGTIWAVYNITSMED